MARVHAKDMTPEQADWFARGLYYMATVDGVDESELALIQRFFDEAGFDRDVRSAPPEAFDSAVAARVLDTEALRRTFLRAAVSLMRADGDISDEEFDALSEVAAAFEQKHILVALLSEAN